MRIGKIGYYALNAGNSIGFLLSGIAGSAAIFSATQGQYELAGLGAIVSLYFGVDAYSNRQDIETMYISQKNREELKKAWESFDKELKRNNDSLDKLLATTSKAP